MDHSQITKALENTGGTDDISKLSAAQWKMRPHYPPNIEKKAGYTLALAQEIVEKYAKKIAKEKNIHDDFNIKFDHELGTGYKIFRGQDRHLILFGAWPHKKNELIDTMDHCLDAYKDIRGSVAIEVWARINEIAMEFEKLGPPPELLELTRHIEITCWRVVEVKEKCTGLTTVYRMKETKGITWTKLIAKAKNELASVMVKLKMIKLEGE